MEITWFYPDMKPLISPIEADQIIKANITLAECETLAIADAYGRYLREDILSDRAVPPFDRVMMDGVAVSSEECHGIGTAFEIAGTQAAGKPQLQKVKSQTCFEVMTGAVLPAGCDCVIPVEEISITGNSVILSPDAVTESGHFIHKSGSDASEGEVLVAAYCKLHSAELAIAASVGKIELQVSKMPRITVLTSGDEVVDPATTPLNYQIRRSHPTAVISTLEMAKLAECNHVHLPDALEETKSALAEALEYSDFLVLTGGVSKGKFDYIAPALTELMGEPLFHGVKQKPGKPFGLWASNQQNSQKRVVAFALPGNPVSVMASLARYVVPALKYHLNTEHSIEQRTLAEDFAWKAPIVGLAPCQADKGGTVVAKVMNNSGDYLSMSNSNGFIYFSNPKTDYRAGELLDFYPLK